MSGTNAFATFHQHFPTLDVQETIEFYSVFSDFPLLDSLGGVSDLKSAISSLVVDNITSLQANFIYDADPLFQNDLESMLIRLAIGDRKNYTVFKKEKIPHMRGKMLYKALFEHKIIAKERSREKPIRSFRGQNIKKSLRHYKVQDKIYFRENFTRFWFTFIAPHLREFPLINKEVLLKTIETHIEEYISLSFEKLSDALLVQRYSPQDVISHGSYWDKNIEIDILIETLEGTCIAGEAKWKNTKICKNLFNALQHKCDKAGLGATHFALCSKSGFSKELLKLQNEHLCLIEPKDFKELF